MPSVRETAMRAKLFAGGGKSQRKAAVCLLEVPVPVPAPPPPPPPPLLLLLLLLFSKNEEIRSLAASR